MSVDIASLDLYFANLPGSPEKLSRGITALKPVLEFQRRLRRHEAQVTFFGAFKAGKSTLLNALLSSPILPSRTNRATGVVTQIGYGESLAAWVVRRDQAGQLRREPVFFDDLARYVLLDLSNGPTAQAPLNIEEVQITLPLPLLQNRCRLVDTPGLLDNAALTARTYEELERTDLAVMVLSADKLVAQAEREAALRAQTVLGGNLVFIVNRLDLVDEDSREDVLDWARSSFSGLGNALVGQPRVFATEAKGALDNRKKNQPLHEASGLLEFEQWLQELLDSPAGQELIARARLASLQSSLTQATGQLQVVLAEQEGQQKRLLKEAAAQAAEQTTRRQAAIREGRARLDRLKAGLAEIAAREVQNLRQQSRAVVQNRDPNWPHLVEGYWAATLQRFTGAVSREVRAVIQKDGQPVPALGLNPYRPEFSFDPGNSAGSGDFISDVTGAVGQLGTWASQTFGLGRGPAGDSALLTRLENQLTGLQTALRDEAEVYLIRLAEQLTETNPAPSTSELETAELSRNREAIKTLQSWLNWCAALGQAVQYLQAGLDGSTYSK